MLNIMIIRIALLYLKNNVDSKILKMILFLKKKKLQIPNIDVINLPIKMQNETEK